MGIISGFDNGNESFSNDSAIILVVKFLFVTPTILLVGYIVLSEISRFKGRIPNLPGPWGYPIVGSLPSLRDTITSDEYLKRATERYGDVFQVQLGNVTAVVVNTTAAARAFFVTQREATNSRPVTYVLHKQVQQNGPVTSIGTSPWDESCKRRRKVAATALNKTSVETYFPILNLESRALLSDFLRECKGGQATDVDVTPSCRKFSLNLSLTLAYGTRVEDVKDLHHDLLLSEIIYLEDEISRLRDPTSNFYNYIPLLRTVNSVADFLGLRRTKAHLASIGKRRYAYHQVLQDKLRRDIANHVDIPCIQGNVLKDPDSKGLTEGELLSVSMSMMAGAHTTKRSLIWACLLLAHRPDIQAKAFEAIQQADPALLQASEVAHTKIPYIEALTKEVGRYFVVLRLALPKATHLDVEWHGATIPPKTLLFLNSWACSRVFAAPHEFAPERWLDGDQPATNRHQYAFGIGGRMCVASHVASKALYTVLLHLIAHFRFQPCESAEDLFAATSQAADPLEGLLVRENPSVEARARMVRLVPRDEDALRAMLSLG
ncbi:cytochrome P450 [Microdochium trichocladiopsis]|uniref:Cytochrome P450 n=1 Tax=Microdochium trichocladiopsis TaxID=1682393 RepID=A0A9P9BGG5_9PEZI|nr:cytochrome P450 [Microdochium trichocladiopsis]KAH7014654.1 cytochrome P450 [Microdochium trichocladiopsis]